MKNMYSAEVQRFNNPIDAREHRKSTVLGVFDSWNEAERFIQDSTAPDRYSDDLGGWIEVLDQFTFLYRIKPVPM